MKHLKSLSDILNTHTESKEVYSSDQRKREFRKNKGYFTRGSSTFSFIHLLKAWEEIVGKMLADNSIPLKIRNKTLIISTKHQIFAQEMSFLDQEIILKITAMFPELSSQITKLKYMNNEFTLQDFNHIRLEPKEKTQKKPKLHPYSPEYKLKLSQAKELFSDIEDQEVKEILVNYYLS